MILTAGHLHDAGREETLYAGNAGLVIFTSMTCANHKDKCEIEPDGPNTMLGRDVLCR